MKILITNDDGYDADGIWRLCIAAQALGELYVVAPATQQSAMSQAVTFNKHMTVIERAAPADSASVVKAYAIENATPATCVKVAVDHLLKENRPDIVLSGINRGYNVGFDIAYSGTIGAAMEAVMNGIPGIAVSCDHTGEDHSLEEQVLPGILSGLINSPLPKNGIMSVNIPCCGSESFGSILYDVPITARNPFTNQCYEHEDGIIMDGEKQSMENEIGDARVVETNNISVGFVPCQVLCGDVKPRF